MSSLLEEIRKAPADKRASALNWLLQSKARSDRQPLSAYCELTPECNLSCKMCYSRLSRTDVEAAGGLCTLEQWKQWISEVVELGALYVAFTGGECLTYPHFDELYRYTYSLGVKIIVMTNGSLISSERIAMFQEMPPDNISMTMYGFSSETYGKACKNSAAFLQVCNAIQMIHEAGLPLQLKCTVTRDMIADMADIYHYAQKMGARFLSSNMLMTSREACHRDCESLAVSDEEYLKQMMKIYSINTEKEILAPLVNTISFGVPSPIGMQCGAGRSTFTINWRGEMIPCNITDVYKVDLSSHSIREAWKKIVNYADNVPQIVECHDCIFQRRCRRCVFLHYGDTGTFGKPSPRICWKRKHPEQAAREEAAFYAQQNE